MEQGLFQPHGIPWVGRGGGGGAGRGVCVCVCVYELLSRVCDPMDCGPPGSSVRGILQAGMLQWVAVPGLLSGKSYGQRSLVGYYSPGEVGRE